MNSSSFYISTDDNKLNVSLIHDWLSNQSYWAKGRSRELVERTIRHSLCFGVYDTDHQQVGFARVVTDFTVYAYILDLFIIESRRGLGLSKMLMEEIMNHPELQLISKWALATRDAHGLYAQFGFCPVASPERLMEKKNT